MKHWLLILPLVLLLALVLPSCSKEDREAFLGESPAILPPKVYQAMEVIRPYYPVDSVRIIMDQTNLASSYMEYRSISNTVAINDAFLSISSVKYTGCAIAHELAHKQQFDLSLPYGEAMPYRVFNACMGLVQADESDYFQVAG